MSRRSRMLDKNCLRFFCCQNCERPTQGPAWCSQECKREWVENDRAERDRALDVLLDRALTSAAR